MSVACVDPVTGAVSNAAANFSTASVPHAFATVVDQAPRCCRPRAPVTRRGSSSRHAPCSTSAKTRRTAFTSGSLISQKR
jgi:hypothetical protein